MSPYETLYVPLDVMERVIAHAQQQAPREACGLLTGPSTAGVDDLVPLPNVAADPTARFEVPDAALLDAFETLDAAARTSYAVYHSHVATAAAPSAADRPYMQEGMTTVIVSLVGRPTVRAWELDRGEIVERRLELYRVE